MQTFIIIILIVIVIAIIVTISNSINRNRAKKEFLNRNGIEPGDYVKFGPYLFGHPLGKTNSDENATIVTKSGEFLFYTATGRNFELIENFRIKMDSITGIKMEDASTIEEKISTGRLLAVGVFALAWKKKEKKELAFLTVSFNDGRFDNDVVFKADSDEAMSWANNVRSWMIKKVHEHEAKKST